LPKDTNRPPIGLIAGHSQFPILFARAARQQGREVVAVAHEGETLPEIEDAADRLRWIKIGQLGKLIRFFKDNDVTEAVMAGGIRKTRLFSRLRPDLKTLSLITKLKDFQDDNALRVFARWLEEEGVTIVAAHDYVPDLVAREGLLTKKAPSKNQQKDIDFGWRMASDLGRLDVGQCIVVRHRTVVAIEAVEGTDETIARGGRLARKRAVVIKRCKPNQDLRFDLPAVGPGTIESMIEVEARCLVIEKDRTLIFDRREMIDLADRHGLVVMVR
jgi:DUF1009 family protein